MWMHNQHKPVEIKKKKNMYVTDLQTLEPCQARPAVLVLLAPQPLGQIWPYSGDKVNM